MKMRHNGSTGVCEEFLEGGKLTRKGLWVNNDGTKANCLDTFGSHFVTGNMLAKSRDEKRQDYNYVLDAINELPPTAGRKIAKEALVKAYRGDCHSRE